MTDIHLPNSTQVCSCCGQPMDSRGCWLDTDDPTGDTWHHSVPRPACSASSTQQNGGER